LSKKKRAALLESEGLTGTIVSAIPASRERPRNPKMGRWYSHLQSSAASQLCSLARITGVAGADGCHHTNKDSKIAHTTGYNAVADGRAIPDNFKFTLEVPVLLAPTTPSHEFICMDCGQAAGNLPENPINLVETRQLSPALLQVSSDLYTGRQFAPDSEEAMLINGATNTAYRRAKGGPAPLAVTPLGAEPSGHPAATCADNEDALWADGAGDPKPASLAEVSKLISDAGPHAMLSVARPLVQLDVAGMHVNDIAEKDDPGVRSRVTPGGKPVSDEFLGEEIVDCCRQSMARVRHTIQVLNGIPNPVAVGTVCELIKLADSMLSHTALLTVDRLGLSEHESNRLVLNAAENAAREAEECREGLEVTINRLQELLEVSETRAAKAELELEAREAEIVGLKVTVKQARKVEKQATDDTVHMLEAMKAEKAKPKIRKDTKKTAAETPQKSAETAPQPSATPASGLADSWWAPGQV
jgi:hypothetical protein